MDHALGFAFIALGAFLIFHKGREFDTASSGGRFARCFICNRRHPQMRPAELSVSSHSAPSGPGGRP